MQLDKRDLITMALLAVVFFSVATWNLGMTQTPVTTAQFSVGSSFYVDLGTATTVKSVVLLLKDGSFNLAVSVGSPDNWQLVTYNLTYSDYYKWYEIGIQRDTQYVKFDFNQSASNAEIAEMAVIGEANQRIPIASINNLGSGNQNLLNLIDEQDKVQYPATYMAQTYFDEIYFARTAEQYLHRQWPYEWTHPPLGKLIQASGITVFGFSPFGWRIMGVVFATLMIPVMYLLGKRLFGTWIGAFASAFLLTFDFMHFTMGRMGTADTYIVFFSLLSQLFFLIYFLNVVKNWWKTSVLPLFLAVVFFAFGFSTKWLVLYGAVGMLALLVGLRLKDVAKLKNGLADRFAAFFDHPFLLLFGFVAVAVGVYFVTYIPDIIIGRSFLGTNGVIDLQFAMYHYHSTLVATHTFASSWWSWPFIVSPHGYVPLWLAVSTLSTSVKSTIVLLGSPAVWWIGFACIILVTERAVQGEELARSLWRRITKKQQSIESGRRGWDASATFIAVIFFFSWIPYVLISRITFIYHFYVSVPFLCLASAYFINKYWNTKKGKIITITFFVSVVVVFGLFYPIISGAPTSTSWIDKLKWFPSWYF